MKKIKKFLNFTSLTLVITLALSIFFVPQKRLNAKNLSEDEQIIQLLLKEYKTVTPLYSTDDNIVAFYVSNGNNYCILNSENYEIIEMSDEHNISFIEQARANSEKVIYTNPLNYYSESSTGEISNQFNQIVKEQLSQCVNFKDIANKNTLSVDNYGLASSKPGIHDYFVKSPNLIPNYSYNPNGICGSTAAAMLLMYYDKVYNDKYVPNSWESANGINLIKKLVPFIDGVKPGSSMDDAIKGLNNYLAQRGFSRTAYNRGTYSLDLRNGPAMLDLGRGIKPYGEHWVVAYGYREFKNILPTVSANSLSIVDMNINQPLSIGDTVSYLIFVVDGWGNRGVLINLKYIEGALYLR